MPGATFKLNFHLKVGINGQKIRGLKAANFQPCTQRNRAWRGGGFQHIVNASNRRENTQIFVPRGKPTSRQTQVV